MELPLVGWTKCRWIFELNWTCLCIYLCHYACNKRDKCCCHRTLLSFSFQAKPHWSHQPCVTGKEFIEHCLGLRLPSLTVHPSTCHPVNLPSRGLGPVALINLYLIPSQSLHCLQTSSSVPWPPRLHAIQVYVHHFPPIPQSAHTYTHWNPLFTIPLMEKSQ